VQAVRLIGVSASAFRPQDTGQLALLDPNAIRRERLARVADRLASRFGAGAVVPAALVWPPRRPAPGAC
jgi:hypothetical protein